MLGFALCLRYVDGEHSEMLEDVIYALRLQLELVGDFLGGPLIGIFLMIRDELNRLAKRAFALWDSRGVGLLKAELELSYMLSA